MLNANNSLHVKNRYHPHVKKKQDGSFILSFTLLFMPLSHTMPRQQSTRNGTFSTTNSHHILFLMPNSSVITRSLKMWKVSPDNSERWSELAFQTWEALALICIPLSFPHQLDLAKTKPNCGRKKKNQPKQLITDETSAEIQSKKIAITGPGPLPSRNTNS